MRRLIWVFAGRTSLLVGFVVHWLNWYWYNLNERAGAQRILQPRGPSLFTVLFKVYTRQTLKNFAIGYEGWSGLAFTIRMRHLFYFMSRLCWQRFMQTYLWICTFLFLTKRWKHISEDTHEMPQSRSTALPGDQRGRDEEPIRTPQTPHMKQQPHKEELQWRNHLGTVSRKIA